MLIASLLNRYYLRYHRRAWIRLGSLRGRRREGRRREGGREGGRTLGGGRELSLAGFARRASKGTACVLLHLLCSCADGVRPFEPHRNFFLQTILRTTNARLLPLLLPCLRSPAPSLLACFPILPCLTSCSLLNARASGETFPAPTTSRDLLVRCSIVNILLVRSRFCSIATQSPTSHGFPNAPRKVLHKVPPPLPRRQSILDR